MPRSSPMSPCLRTSVKEWDRERSAARNRARSPRRSRSDRRRRARHLAGRRHRPTSMPRCLRWKPKAPRCAATSSPTAGHPRSVVRSPAARAHSSLHGQASARRDRAGAGARLPALPVRLAARHADARACRGRMQCRRCSVNSKAFDAPASAWETEVLPARIAEYDPAWLDEQCLAGRIVWTRLATRAGDAERGAAPVRSTPIALLARRNVRLWSSFAERPETPQLTPKAQEVAAFIQTHGASFFDEIVEGAQAPADAGRRRARRAGRARHRELRQLRRPARAAGAGRSPAADCARCASQAAHRDLRHAGRGALGAGPQRAASRKPAKTSSTCAARCCDVGASCSGKCWSAKRTGCRRGDSC